MRETENVCYNCLVDLPDDEYHLGYFEGVRNVAMKYFSEGFDHHFERWLQGELKEALRLRDES